MYEANHLHPETADLYYVVVVGGEMRRRFASSRTKFFPSVHSGDDDQHFCPDSVGVLVEQVDSGRFPNRLLMEAVITSTRSRKVDEFF